MGNAEFEFVWYNGDVYTRMYVYMTKCIYGLACV